jgi:hypothetical protein
MHVQQAYRTTTTSMCLCYMIWWHVLEFMLESLLLFYARKLLMHVEMIYVSMFYFKMGCGHYGKSNGQFAVEL